jgi:DNA (cytosine-5)-methyltransferase 1
MIKAIDFFCGAGGLTRGLLDSGIKVLAGVDIDEKLEETYKNNNKPSKFYPVGIDQINIFNLRKDLGITNQDKVLYAACTPCQPFSALNRQKDKGNKRELLLSFGEIVKACPPDFILIENVPGLKNAYGKEIYHQFLEMIESVGFKPETEYRYSEFLDANDFDVPQVRKRFILLASRKGKLVEPQKSEVKPFIETVLKAYPAIGDGEKSDKFHNHEARKLPPNQKLIIEAVPKDGGNRSDVKDQSILLPCHQNKPKVYKDVFSRMAWKKPAPTMTARCVEVANGRFAHPTQNRAISFREAAAIQSFADDYIFYGSNFHIARQIGNAVPPKFAQKLGEAIVNTYLTFD